MAVEASSHLNSRDYTLSEIRELRWEEASTATEKRRENKRNIYKKNPTKHTSHKKGDRLYVQEGNTVTILQLHEEGTTDAEMSGKTTTHKKDRQVREEKKKTT